MSMPVIFPDLANLKVVDEGGVKAVEGVPREQLLTCVEDVTSCGPPDDE
jgi:hypothetical protein